MDDPSLGDMIAQHRDGIGGAGVLSLLFSATYSIAKGFDLKMAFRSAVSSVVFGSAGYFFVVNMWHLPAFYVVPIGLVAAYVTVPLAQAWARRDEKLAEKAMDIAQRRFAPDDKKDVP